MEFFIIYFKSALIILFKKLEKTLKIIYQPFHFSLLINIFKVII